MKLSRREVLLGVGFVLLPASVLTDTTRMVKPAAMTMDFGGQVSEMLGFNGLIPGPVPRAQQGDVSNVVLENGTDDGTQLHWHGNRVPNAMDGVNVLTQDAMPQDTTYNYRFSLPDAETFWFHSHKLAA